jgi:membrane-bound metal-dependent hydrolase YbcI (DUF457 family)
MERGGHYGTSLLLSAGCLLWLDFLQAVVAVTVIFAVERLPDQDHYIPEWAVKHRGPTHSLTFAVVVAFVLASTIAYPVHLIQSFVATHGPLSAPVVPSVEVWALIGGAALLSLVGHIATDALTVGGGYKVEPLWPFDSRTVAAGLCRADDVRWNVGLLAAGATAFVAAVLHELYYSVVVILV